MFENVVDWCARRKGLVLAVALVLGVLGAVSLSRSSLDALPDLTDPQVIVWTEWMGRSPQLVEDQVTYPLVSRLLSAPHVKTVRGFSMFGMSFVFVVFEDGTDTYWARSRVPRVPLVGRRLAARRRVSAARPRRDRIRWVFAYTLEDRSGEHDLQELRAFQDFTLRYALAQVPGVAEVASVGGYQKQYQIVVDPSRLQAYGVGVPDVIAAARMSNTDVGGRVVEWSGREYVFRGLGYVKSKEDLEEAVVRTDRVGARRCGSRTSNRRDRRRHPPRARRVNGEGEAVGGIVVMRSGRERARRDRPREGEARGARAFDAEGRLGARGLRPLRTHPRVDLHAARRTRPGDAGRFSSSSRSSCSISGARWSRSSSCRSRCCSRSFPCTGWA